MAIEVLSPIVITIGALVLIGLERLIPYDREQRLFRDGFWTDLVWYTFVQSSLLAVVISWIIRRVDAVLPMSQLGLVASWSLGWQVGFFLVIHDIYIYFFHRWQHSSKLLWRIHEAHHSVRDVDWLAGSRSHALEIFINQTIEFLPMTLLGAAPELPLVKGMIDAVWGMYIHSNIAVSSGLLQRVINGPEMHRWHHARNPVKGGANFSTKFAVWDWLFGSAYLPETKPSGYGLRGSGFPNAYFFQLFYAFRKFKKSSHRIRQTT